MYKFLLGEHAARFADWGPTILRVPLGAIFLYHGWDKVANVGMENLAGFLASIGIPLSEIMAYVLAYGELAIGALLIGGLLTRLAAKLGVIVGIVALLLVHLPNGFAVNEGGYEFIMLILAASISVMLTGGGRLSIDCMWLKKSTGPVM